MHLPTHHESFAENERNTIVLLGGDIIAPLLGLLLLARFLLARRASRSYLAVNRLVRLEGENLANRPAVRAVDAAVQAKVLAAIAARYLNWEG
jgi:hypothetical protein